MEKKISIVIPCYNEEEVLDQLFKRVTKSAESWKKEWEAVCVDDGSKDSTWHKLKTQSEKDPRWKALSFSRNFGHQTAISCGLYHAHGDAVIVMDADLQDPPEELHRYISKWEEGYDVVYAIRTKRKEGLFKRLGYKAFYRILSKLVDFNIPLDSGDFSLMDKKVVEVLRNMPERNRFVRGLRAWSGFKQVGLEYERSERLAGETKYPFKKLLKLAFDGVFSFSTIPLTMASYFGLVVSGLALIGAIFTLLQKLFSNSFAKIGLGPVPGYATTLISILFLGGIQLIFLGIIGSYLSRIYDEVKGRPHWIIREKVGLDS
ncbi:MAG: glycosyltransferase family 2 protein [Patescibacteria group bacterium]